MGNEYPVKIMTGYYRKFNVTIHHKAGTEGQAKGARLKMKKTNLQHGRSLALRLVSAVNSYNLTASKFYDECSMSAIDGFAPIVSGNACVLILGTMPGEASLLRQQYYGHPGNAFWPIMSALLGLDPELCYQRRKEMLMENGIAVWDVLQSCHRLGSLDSDIKLATIRTNDFASFFTEYTGIKRVFFNGRMAEKLYQKRILPALNHRFSYLEYQCLPSTSPAYASLKLEQKIEAWKAIKQSMVK